MISKWLQYTFYVKIAIAKYHTINNQTTYCISYDVETYYSNEVLYLQF